MHLPTYLFLMTIATIFGAFQLYLTWSTNSLLFIVSIATLVITSIGALLQSIEQEAFKFKWMVWYIIPLSLIVLGNLAYINELYDRAFLIASAPSNPHLMPGRSVDYYTAARHQLISMIFPTIALIFSYFVRVLLLLWKKYF